MSQENENKGQSFPEQVQPAQDVPAVSQEEKVDASGNEAEDNFNFDLIKKYPHANRRVNLQIEKFGLASFADDKSTEPCQSLFISPYGMEFRTGEDFPDGELLKIHVVLPDYWERKQKFVDYTRIDTPQEFRILAKVVRTEDASKRGRKKLVTVQTLIIDEVDEQVLKGFLKEG